MKLFYEIESGGASGVRRELPFVVGVLADFSGSSQAELPRLRERRFVEIRQDNFDAVMSSMNPRLQFRVPLVCSADAVEVAAESEPMLRVDLRFHRMADFDPAAVGAQIPELRLLIQRRELFQDLLVSVRLDAALDAVVSRSLNQDATALAELSACLIERESREEEGDGAWIPPEPVLRMLRDCGWTEYPWREWTYRGATRALAELLLHASQYPVSLSRDAGAMIESAITLLSERIGRQLDEVMHNPSFQKMEAAWRGVEFLLARCGSLPGLKIKVLTVSKKILLRDLQRAPEFDQSALFLALYREFGALGGEPFNVLVGDFEFSAQPPEDVELLERISWTVASSHCLFLAAASPALLRLESDTFADLDIPYSLRRVFETSEYRRWTGFRRDGDSRYIGLVLPRMLLRAPYNSAPAGFVYLETIRRPDDLLWGNAAFALAACLAAGVCRDGLEYAPCGVEKGGLVSGLPVWSQGPGGYGESGERVGATSTPVGDARQAELAQLGLISFCQRTGSGEAVFFDLPSCYEPPFTNDSVQYEQAWRGSHLEHTLVLSRFAHYLKCILRDKVGVLSHLPLCEEFLDEWIQRYVRKDGETTFAPLESGRLCGAQSIGREGIVAMLTPRFRNRSNPVALRVVISLPQFREVWR